MKPKSNSSSPSTSPREKEKANVGLRGRHGGQWNIDAIEEEKEVNKNAPSNGSFSALDQLDEYLISDYEVYDDMIEMIIQLGFVLFFIPLFPVYSTVCVFLSNFIEVRSDLFKLCYVVKRSSNIRFGMSENVVYIYVLRIFVVIAVLINMFLFLLIYADDNLDNMPQTAPVQVEQSTDTILFAIYVEHFLIIVILFLFWRIPSVPYKVEDYLGERFYKRLISYSSNPTNNLSQRFKKEM
ncbi:Calcium-activated chloride channel, putative [Angomonas deanei]|uniref:Calcium-activated chloride channel, putative n=1 Tax=Angomonas deanei TaxID=59799 RepID=A0A7G2CKG4_9TRYP|nr:Calcium-activated chloride channel, putative [Angomonas deanei]